MKKKSKKCSFGNMVGPIGEILWNLMVIAVGSVLCAVAVNGILIPQHFYGAGFTGLALLIHYLKPALPLAVIYFILNIPMFSLGWMYVGRRFFLYSIAGMLIFSGAIAWTHISLPIYDKILSALLAGIIMGFGSGVILRSLGSAGGLDILSVILFQRFSIRLGTTILGFNSLVLVAGTLLFSLENAVYTLIYLYVNAHIVNVVVTGLSQRKAIFIVSRKWDEISKEIMGNIQRGVTILKGRSGYEGRDMQIIYTVIAMQELHRLKNMVRKIDPDAFVVVSDTLEVIGTRIGNQPRW